MSFFMRRSLEWNDALQVYRGGRARRRAPVPEGRVMKPICVSTFVSVSVSDSAHCCWLLPTSATHPDSRINQRPSALVSAPNRHGVQEVASSNLAAPIG
jgi:hypothetical protein